MKFDIDRRSTSIIGRWWWTVDRPTFFAMMALVCIGLVMVMAGSPPVAQRIGLPNFYFVTRHEIFLGLSLIVMLGVSVLSIQQVRRLAFLGFCGGLLLLMLLPFVGIENKGSVRWIYLFGMSLQPSEFIKPCFAVLLGWVFAARAMTPDFPSYKVAVSLYFVVVLLLVIQPDFGMIVTITGMFATQFFLAGMPMLWVLAMLLLAVLGGVTAYHSFSHVASRIDRFLDPTSGDNYQVQKSLQAFREGGLFGRGLGEGEIKHHIPDSHTDFVFAVAGEEFGMLFCLVVIVIFAYIVVRGFMRLSHETDMFRVLSVAGLLAQFGIQAIVNMGVAVNLLPAKGMTLPFLSYGGSSLLAMALGMGMLLALTRRTFGEVK